jgi:hypothetical protein
MSGLHGEGRFLSSCLLPEENSALEDYCRLEFNRREYK